MNTNKPDTQHSDWRNELLVVSPIMGIRSDDGDRQIVERFDEYIKNKSQLEKFIASEKSKSYKEGIRKAVEVVENIKPMVGWNTEHIGRNDLKAELNQLLK